MNNNLFIVFGKLGSIKFFISACGDEEEANEEKERLLKNKTMGEGVDIEIEKLSQGLSQKIREKISNELGI